MNFKSHKIRGIDKNICNAEQVIAYNYLRSLAQTNNKSCVLDCVKRLLAEKAREKSHFDYDLVFHYILQSYDRYIEQKKPIFSDYEKLASIIYSDDFTE